MEMNMTSQATIDAPGVAEYTTHLIDKVREYMEETNAVPAIAEVLSEYIEHIERTDFSSFPTIRAQAFRNVQTLLRVSAFLTELRTVNEVLILESESASVTA